MNLIAYQASMRSRLGKGHDAFMLWSDASAMQKKVNVDLSDGPQL